jgi:hypothetical protein
MYECVCGCGCVSSLNEFDLDLQNMHVIQLIPGVIQSTAIQNQSHVLRIVLNWREIKRNDLCHF